MFATDLGQKDTFLGAESALFDASRSSGSRFKADSEPRYPRCEAAGIPPVLPRRTQPRIRLRYFVFTA